MAPVVEAATDGDRLRASGFRAGTP